MVPQAAQEHHQVGGKRVKYVLKISMIVLLLLGVASAQSAQPAQPAQPATATDVYHVHFNKATPGEAAALGQRISTVDPKAPMPGHFIVLRHQEGDEWDYCVIEHLGNKATVTPEPSAVSPGQRDQSAWHGDTFVSGPSWAEFTRAMGIGEGKDRVANAIYIVTVYRAAPGHREQLQKFISQPPGSKVPTGAVVMEHLEGGPWNFLTITRYNSWQDLATDRSTVSPEGWNENRNHTAFHRDTIADRIAPK